MKNKVDVLENDILELYPKVLDILLFDNTTKKNVTWGTSNYDILGDSYNHYNQIFPEQITGDNGSVIMPRIKKEFFLQQKRIKNMAEVFTPSWICNAQNNLIDDTWFNKKNIFNKEIQTATKNYWETNNEKIIFPKNKTWKDYIKEKTLEITCGEGPYITSRYDTTTGEFIESKNRIGLLDRKLRVINENIDQSKEWLKSVQNAYENTYAYEWQGDNLLLTRESMLFTFIDNYKYKFHKKPSLKSIQKIANIISWNIWQMDGIKGVIPTSCSQKVKKINLFGEEEIHTSICEGCLHEDIMKHNGIYCVVKDWSKKEKSTGKFGAKIKFINLLKY